MNRTAWIFIGVLCILGFGGLVYITKKDTVDVNSIDPTAIIASTETSIGDHVEGNPNAKVTLFEYGDFQCPGCGGAHENTPNIQKIYRDKVRFVFRNYPLISIHPNALAAASVAEAAGLQGKYREMSNLLYSNQSQWVSLSADQRGDVFLSYANQLSLNVDQYTSDVSSTKVQKKIQSDQAIGNKAGVQATPSFFIGNQQVDSAIVSDVIQNQGTKLMDKLDQVLRDAGETPPSRQ